MSATRTIGLGLVWAAASLLAPAWARQGAPTPPAPAPAVNSAEDLLRRLERADEAIRTLEADISYDRRFMLQGDRHVRTGRLYFRRNGADARPRKTFAVWFETLVAGERQQDDPQVWAFDGRWLVESRPAQKRWTKREIAREGESFDPLRVGEGPMPIPIGQKADDILKRFDAELLPPEQGLTDAERAGLPFLSNTWQLRLTPRPGAGEGQGKDEFREVRLWYDRATLLPRLARTINRARDESFVVLLNLALNDAAGLPPGRIDPPEPPDGQGWDKQVQTLAAASSGAAAQPAKPAPAQPLPR